MYLDWVFEPYMTDYELLLFNNSINHCEKDYIYHPIAIAKRDEIGVKYRYLCIAKTSIYPHTSCKIMIIEVYKPPQGKPYVTRLFPIDFNSLHD